MAGRTPPLESITRGLRGVKRRLLWVFVSFGLGASLTWYFRKPIILWLLAPAGDYLSGTGQPIFTGPTEIFSLVISLVVKGGIIAAAPFVVYNVLRLLWPLLGQPQKRLIVLVLPMGLFFYLSGVVFAYYVLLPTGLRFLLQFGEGIAVPMIRITEYMDMALALIFWLGVVFELPVVMFLLAKLRLVSYQQFRRLRRYVPMTAFFLGALITPTIDIVNQTLVSVPLIVLFEVGLALTWLVRPRV